jgi:hypothetical protein
MCESCEALNINGIKCHETGCPDAWKDKYIECKECGTLFQPEEKYQVCCSVSCHCAYNGYPYIIDEEIDLDDFS